MNKAIITGRMTRDPEVKYNTRDDGSQNATARFTLAVDRDFKREGQPEADFINCVAFGRTADFVSKYGSKGTKYEVAGRIQTGSYTNREGNKVYTTDVMVEEIHFAESKKAQPGQGQPQAQPQQQAAPQQYQQPVQQTAPQQQTPADQGWMNVPDGSFEDFFG